MKNLAFTIAKRIAIDKSPNTVLICASILKDAFISEGIPAKEANTMAIDGVKVIMNTMLRCVK